MNDELMQLMAEKRELERRINLLKTGGITHDNVKIDRIGFAGYYQRGKWALFCRYKHTVARGRNGIPEERTKWQTIINGDSKEDVVKQIPDLIKALNAIYEEASNGTDT
jgi:hypothetical protein